MPTYSTPLPVTASIQLVSGDLRIEASDRVDSVVDVTPSNDASDADVQAAGQTRVEFVDGILRVIGAKGRSVGLLRKPGSVRVVVSVPTGSHITAATGLGRVTSAGHLGDCRIRSGAGDVSLDDAASINLVTGIGAISAARVSGDARCVTGSGSVRIAQVGGTGFVKNSNGDTWLGNVGSAIKVKASNGTISVDRASGDVRAATANGDVRIGSVQSGSVELKTGLGTIEVGIADGTAAHLDLHTSYGYVVNNLHSTDRPRSDESTVEISAQTSAGDIVLHRAQRNA